MYNELRRLNLVQKLYRDIVYKLDKVAPFITDPPSKSFTALSKEDKKKKKLKKEKKRKKKEKKKVTCDM